MVLTGAGLDGLVCSAQGCRAGAVYGIVWNNPRVHAPERRKVWLACEEHREPLSAFVGIRGFLLEVVPVEALEDDASSRGR